MRILERCYIKAPRCSRLAPRTRRLALSRRWWTFKPRIQSTGSKMSLTQSSGERLGASCKSGKTETSSEKFSKLTLRSFRVLTKQCPHIWTNNRTSTRLLRINQQYNMEIVRIRQKEKLGSDLRSVLPILLPIGRLSRTTSIPSQILVPKGTTARSLQRRCMVNLSAFSKNNGEASLAPYSFPVRKWCADTVKVVSNS
jgi:hypothetical protein